MMSRRSLRGNQNHLRDDDQEANPRWVHQLAKQFRPGDIAWTKISDSSWWPVQVVNEKSVRCKSKKKEKDEVLVRLYGSYEYLYVDAVKCSSEFANTLKLENSNYREAFQKALEEEIAQMKSGGRSKRKVSGSIEVEASEASKRKGQKQKVVEGNQEPNCPAPPEAHAGKPNEAKAVQKKVDYSEGVAFGDGSTKQYDLRETKPQTYPRMGNESSSKRRRRNEALQEDEPKGDEVKKQKAIEASNDYVKEGNDSEELKVAKRVTRGRASEVKTTSQDEARRPNVAKKSRNKASNGAGDDRQKLKFTKEEVGAAEAKSSKQIGSKPAKHQDTAEKNPKSPGDVHGKSKESGTKQRGRDEASSEKETKRDEGKKQNATEISIRNIKKGSDSKEPKVTARLTRSTSKAKIAQQNESSGQNLTDGSKKPKLTRKSNTVVAELKITKQDGSTLANQTDEIDVRKLSDSEEPEVAERATKATSKAKTAQQSEAMRKNAATESKDKASNGTGDGTQKLKPKKKEKTVDGELRNSKQGASIPEEQPYTKQNLQRKKAATLEEPTELSSRKIRVMQNLGLIPPAGSPFGRNGLT